MKARTVLGAVIGLCGVGAAGFGLLHLGTMGQATPPASSKAAPAPPSKQIGATQSGPAVVVGIASGYPPVEFKDTGMADWTYNPAGWDYAGRGVLYGS